MIKFSVAVLIVVHGNAGPKKNDGLLIGLDTSFTEVPAFKAIANLFHKLPIRS